MVPGIRRDDAWMPAFAGMTNYDTVSEGGGRGEGEGDAFEFSDDGQFSSKTLFFKFFF